MTLAEGKGYELTNHVSPAFVIAADLNPGDGKSSENHEERGQNVLFGDGHVNASPVDAADTILLLAQKSSPIDHRCGGINSKGSIFLSHRG